MTTNALRLAKAAGIQVETREYAVDETDLSAGAVAAKIGLDADRVFKTLVAVGDKSGAIVCVIPGSAELDLRKAAKASGNKTVGMLAVKELEPLTGYVRGGCSPIGLKKRLPVYVDETATMWETISVSAGIRGLQMIIAPTDLVSLCSGEYRDLI